MKILLIGIDFPEVNADDSIFPFGYAAIGAVLEKNGHKVQYILPGAHRFSMNDVLGIVSETKAGAIGIGGLYPYLSTVKKFVEKIKKIRPDIPVVLGGQMVTYTPEFTLNLTGADFCIAGEGEISMLKLMNAIEKKTDFTNIPGLIFKKSGGVIQNNGISELIDFDEIPMPDWDQFPMEYYLYSGSYLPVWSRAKKERVFAWNISRGCPFNCNFCASGAKARYKSIDRIFYELDDIVNKFNPDYLLFVDNFLLKNKKYAIEFCGRIVERKYKFKFSATGRADIMDNEIIFALKQAGCDVLFYGLESANDGILKLMNKKITVEQIEKAVRITKEAGIYPMVSIMFGQPGEKISDFFNSLRVIMQTVNDKDPQPNIASVMPLLTFPGAPIYEYAKKRGFFNNDEDYWNKYGGNFRINYSAYPEEIVRMLMDVGNALNKWNYFRAMEKNIRTNFNKLFVKFDIAKKNEVFLEFAANNNFAVSEVDEFLQKIESDILKKSTCLETDYSHFKFTGDLLQSLKVGKTAIFGAALTGLRCMNELQKIGIQVVCFIDNNAASDRKEGGVPVVRFVEFKDKYSEISDAVVIASRGAKQAMRSQLAAAGYEKHIIDYIDFLEIFSYK